MSQFLFTTKLVAVDEESWGVFLSSSIMMEKGSKVSGAPACWLAAEL